MICQKIPNYQPFVCADVQRVSRKVSTGPAMRKGVIGQRLTSFVSKFTTNIWSVWPVGGNATWGSIMNNSLMTLGKKLDAFFKCLANISLKNRSMFSVANLMTKICLESTFFWLLHSQSWEDCHFVCPE